MLASYIEKHLTSGTHVIIVVKHVEYSIEAELSSAEIRPEVSLVAVVASPLPRTRLANKCPCRLPYGVHSKLPLFPSATLGYR
jgi:hypothetical protein